MERVGLSPVYPEQFGAHEDAGEFRLDESGNAMAAHIAHDQLPGEDSH
jgi:hypothetical protein